MSARNASFEFGHMMIRATSRFPRIGAVSYLNSRPLIEGLSEMLPEADVRLDYPSRLADSLSHGELDVALIPSVEYFRGCGAEIVSDACVAAHGPVMSVKLYCRTHPGDVQRVAMDEGSRTSAALARVILAERYGVFPTTEPLPLTSDTRNSDADAVLLIGDRAMHTPNEPFHTVMDLGEMWMDWTGLPFVFAMWVARSGFEDPRIDEALGRARDLGVGRLNQIARRDCAAIGITEQVASDYLIHNLHYRMTSAERSGLRLFCDLAASHNLVNEHVDLVFRDLVSI